MNGRAISFGPFLLLAEERLLLEGDRPVRLGSRAFDILVFLIERAGKVVGKEELIARVWPQTVVEEANLKIQISALRRALGDGQGGNRYIVTVVGRGYNFVAAIRIEEPSRTRPRAMLSIGEAQFAVCGDEDNWSRASRRDTCFATVAPAPGDGDRAGRYRQNDSRPRRRRTNGRRIRTWRLAGRFGVPGRCSPCAQRGRDRARPSNP